MIIKVKVKSDTIPAHLQVMKDLFIEEGNFESLSGSISKKLAEANHAVNFANMSISIDVKSVGATTSKVYTTQTLTLQDGDAVVLTAMPKDFKAGVEEVVFSVEELKAIKALVSSLEYVNVYVPEVTATVEDDFLEEDDDEFSF